MYWIILVLLCVWKFVRMCGCLSIAQSKTIRNFLMKQNLCFGHQKKVCTLFKHYLKLGVRQEKCILYQFTCHGLKMAL